MRGWILTNEVRSSHVYKYTYIDEYPCLQTEGVLYSLVCISAPRGVKNICEKFLEARIYTGQYPCLRTIR